MIYFLTNESKGGEKMTIAEASKKYEISADTLRYYERIGLIPPVPRNKSGIRDYDEESCGWIELMKCMRAAGVQIEALIEYVALFQQGDETIDARKTLLIEQRDQLMVRMADMQRSLDRLNDKIDRYEQGLMTKEQQLRRAEARRLAMQAEKGET
jgi:DNA-binding transcriptional MerR regulator